MVSFLFSFLDSVFRTDRGDVIEESIDKRVGELFDALLDKVSALKNPLFDQSLGKAMEKILPAMDPLRTGTV